MRLIPLQRAHELAPELLVHPREARRTTGFLRSPDQHMTRESQLRAAAVVLALCTVAVIVFGIINFQKEREYVVPDDGIWWLESEGQLYAERVTPLGPGERAGLKAGDQLADINGRAIHSGADRV